MKAKRKTKAQRDAAKRLEDLGIIHYLLREQRCPVIHEGKLAFVRCPGVSREAFKQAIDRLVLRNLVAYVDQHIPKAPSGAGSEPGEEKRV